jgi:hypothetical protein
MDPTDDVRPRNEMTGLEVTVGTVLVFPHAHSPHIPLLFNPLYSVCSRAWAK